MPSKTTESGQPSGDGAQDTSQDLAPVKREIIAYWVQVAALLGYPRSVGEIFGCIFVSADPMNADDLVGHLGISRSGAGQGIKILLDIGAIRPAHNLADRREHFQMQNDLGVLVKQFLNARVFPPLEELRRQRDTITETVAASGDACLMQRFDKLQRWQNKSLPIIKILKTLTV